MIARNATLAANVFRFALIVGCAISAVFMNQSCGKKPNESDNDTLPKWRQYSIDGGAAWSPDGSKIIYYRHHAAGGRDTSWTSGVFLHDVATGKDTCIWPDFEYLTCSWSPDGSKLAFSDANAQICVYDFIDGTSTQLTYGHRFHSPQWSPCGDKLSFVERTNDGGLFLYDFNTDSLIHVVSRVEADAGDWMADCSTLVMFDSTIYTSVYDSCVIVNYNVYTDSLHIIAKLTGYMREIRISPDQQTIVFVVYNDIWAMSIDGGEPYQLTTKGGGYPDFSPDGQWIVYTKIDFWYPFLWLMRPDGSEKHQITF